ncbi:MAG: tRNA uridine-5-carboxymethylaminomethyl(34) synthesis GTPase MnmE, partial [Gemmatimonadota bacterium]|nr:tRNA uridine-5-carboxymethylaminomethyl(34) synthesis GTPase MnmE [Gemmatimonadota bacterium]
LEKSLSEVHSFRNAENQLLPPEIAATHLQEAELALETQLGEIDHEDVLDALFRSFCVGK